MTDQPIDTATTAEDISAALGQAAIAPPAPAYGTIKARTAFMWGGRRLAPGEVVIDIRARGGQADFDTFRNLLRWSAFAIEQIEGPAAPPAPVVPTITPAELDALRAQLAEAVAALAQARTSEANAIAARDAAQAAVPAPAPAAPIDLIAAIATAAPADLVALPGIGEKKASDLIAAAQDLIAQRTPAPPA